jgi:hypothetical protein
MKPNLKLVGKEPETILPYRRGESASEIAERIRLGIRREPMCRLILGDAACAAALAPSGPSLLHVSGLPPPAAIARGEQ